MAARVHSDPEGGFHVTFPYLPETITGGTDEAEAKLAPGLALRGCVADGGCCSGSPQICKSVRPGLMPAA